METQDQARQRLGPPCFEITSDHWRFLSRSSDSNYPDWKVLPNPSAYKTAISINPDAVDEVMVAVQRLPLSEDRHHTIGLEVTGNEFRLLGKSRPELPWTKIVIPESGTTGPHVTIFLDRRMLLKALRFGLTRIEIIDPKSPIRFSLTGRQMIVMPLRINVEGQTPTPPPPTTATSTPDNTNPPLPAEQPTPTPMQTSTPTIGQAKPAGANGSSTPPAQGTTNREDSKSSLEAALVQIEAIKTGFRESINGLTKLGDHIRQSMREQKTSEKEIHNVRQTLRTFQSVPHLASKPQQQARAGRIHTMPGPPCFHPPTTKGTNPMIAHLEFQAPTFARRPPPNLILHCGARAAERHQIIDVPTPYPTESWTPIPHIDLVKQVENTIRSNGLVVGTQAHSLTHDGMRYFGLMEIQRRDNDQDYCWVLGLRNSHDKTFPAGITAGASVFVCDNLSFSGEVKLARKHTHFIMRDLPGLVQSAVGRLMERWHHQDSRIANYKLADLDEPMPTIS